MTFKQAAAELRKGLDRAAAGEVRRYTRADGGEFVLRVPRGLRFNVRATKKGVNVTIEDDGYAEAVTGGDPGRFFTDGHDEPVLEHVREFVRFGFVEDIGVVKWGRLVVITSTSLVTPRPLGGGER